MCEQNNAGVEHFHRVPGPTCLDGRHVKSKYGVHDRCVIASHVAFGTLVAAMEQILSRLSQGGGAEAAALLLCDRFEQRSDQSRLVSYPYFGIIAGLPVIQEFLESIHTSRLISTD